MSRDPWEIVRLSDVLDERKESPEPGALEKAHLRVISKIGFREGIIQLRTDAETRTKMILVYPGDLVISGINATKGAIGICTLENRQPIAATIHYSAYTPKIDKVDVRYLWWLLRSRDGQKKLSQLLPSGIKTELRAKRFLTLNISLPPISTQRVLAERIDQLAKMTTQLNGLRARAIDEAKALLVSTRRRLFDRAGKEGWSFQPLKDCCEALIDYRGRTPPLALEGIPHITSANIRNGIIDWKTQKFVSEKTYQNYMTRGIPRAGDVIFTTEAPLGETAVVPDNRRFSLAQRTLLLRAREGVTTGPFLAKVLTSPSVRDDVYSKASGTTVKGISSKRLSKVFLPIPPPSEQDRIVKYLAEFEGRVYELSSLQTMTIPVAESVLPSVLETML